MTGFVIATALLLALAAGLLRPAWRTSPAAAAARPAAVDALGEQLAALDRERAAGQLDADQHQRARAELQRRLLAEAPADPPALNHGGARLTGIALTIAVPLFAAALYLAIGNPGAIVAAPPPDAPSARAAPDDDVSPEAVQAMLASLAQRLQTPSGNPETDLQGWTMLARSYAALQRFADADQAYARAIALAPRDAQLLADRADVLAMQQGQRTAGEPERLIQQALQIDPKNLKALALAGSAAYERKDLAAARGYWQQARALAPAGTPFADGLDRSLAEVGGNDDTAAATASPLVPARIAGRVSLAPALAARVAAGDTVFIFARAAQGPRMPLAILRRSAADLPFTFTLDDSLAMSAALKLSAFDRVVVGARISRAGSATPQAGDLLGTSGEVGVRVDGLDLVIDQVQP